MARFKFYEITKSRKELISSQFFFSKQTKLKLRIFIKDITEEIFFENYTAPKLNIRFKFKFKIE